MPRKSKYEDIGKDVKEYFYNWNENTTKLRRRKGEKDGTFIGRILKAQNKYLKKLIEYKPKDL